MAFFGWIIPAIVLVLAAALSLWLAGAIYYDVCKEARWGRLAVLVWVGSVATLFTVWQPLWQPLIALLVFTSVFLVWWLSLKPNHEREWEPAVALLPRVVRGRDSITIDNIRNFDYPAPGVVIPRYETRTFHLDNLEAADIIFFNWGLRWMSHPVLVFDFGPDGRLCVSIEVRYRKGQKYSFLRSCYRQQELIFLAADERDIILRRTKHAPTQEAHLYRLQTSAEELRTVFLDYVGAMESLYDRPRWYHGLCANCTTTFYRLPSRRLRIDWRVLANSRLDRALYETGRLDRTLPFPELRRLASLNDIANRAPEAGFGDYVRSELERRCHDR